MATARNGGLISFQQLRRTAEAVREAQCWSTGSLPLTNSGLQRDIATGCGGEEARVELRMAVIEWHRLSGMVMDVSAAFDGIAGCIDEGSSESSVKEVIRGSYSDEEQRGLSDWLVQLIGSRASLAMTGKERGGQVAGSISSPAILLDCLSQLNRESSNSLPASHFHVIALDGCLKAAKWNEGVAAAWSRFRSTISTSTKLALLAKDFELRKRREEREQMYTDIFAGANYVREPGADTNHRRKLVVKRDAIVKDSMGLIDRPLGSMLFNGIQVQFDGEEGEDGGGLTKEWIALLSTKLAPSVFRQEEKEASRSELDPSCSVVEAELMGVVIGLSLYHQVAIDVAPSRTVYRRLLSRPTKPSLNDVDETRPGLAKGLRQMLQWRPQDFSERLSINFTHSTSFDHSEPLIEGGQDTAVTYSNRDAYVQRMCEFIVMERSQAQLEALFHGFERVCLAISSLQLFTIDEFDSLIPGQQGGISVDLLKRMCTIDGGGGGVGSRAAGDYVDQLWSTLDTLGSAVRTQLLYFVTANHRISLAQSVAFHIVILHGQEFVNRLPTASTCSNTLFLPRYPSTDVLQSRLLIALQQGSVGFGLK